MTEITAAATAGQSSSGEGSKNIIAKLGKLRERYRNRNAPAAGGVSVQRNELMAEPATTHHEFSRRRLKRREGTETDKVTLNPELIKQYSTFMETYITNLQELKKNHELVLNHPNFRHERDLMLMLSKNGSPDKAAIERFVQTNQGIAVTTQVLEDQTALMIFSLGLDMNARYGGDGPWGAKDSNFAQHMPGSTLLNLGRSGIMREGAGRLAHMFGTDVMGRFGGAASIATGATTGAYLANVDIAGFISAVGGAMTPTMIGAILGGGAGAAVARRFFQPNGDVDLTACPDGLNAIKGNPELLDYVRIMTKVNPNDFDVVGNRVVSTGGTTTTQNIEHIRRTIDSNLQTRSAFYEALGYPGTRRGDFFEQLMTRPNVEGQRQWMTKWNQRMVDLTVGGVPPATTTEDYMNARRIVLAEYIQDYGDKILGGTNREGAVTNIDKQIAEVAKRKAKVVETQGKRATRAGQDITFVERAKTELYGKKPTPEGGVSIDEAQKALDDARNAVGKIERGKTHADIPTMIIDVVRLIDAQKTNLNALPGSLQTLIDGINTDPGVRAGYTEQRPVYDEHGRVVGYEDVMPSRKEMLDHAHDSIEKQSVAIERELTRLQKILERIELADANIKAAEKTLKDLGGKEFSPFVQRSREMLQIITGFGTPPITVAELANPTISIDTLLQRINRAHRATHTGLPNEPWSESDNDREEIRQRLLQARLEARVQVAAEFYIPTHETSLQIILGAGRVGESHITEAELVTMDLVALKARLNSLNNSNPAIFTTDWTLYTDVELQMSIDAAKLRAEFRKAELDHMAAGLKGIQKDAESRVTAAKDPAETKQLGVMRDLATRQGDVFSHLTSGEAELRLLLESQDTVRADRDLNDSERRLVRPSAHIPRGYFRMIDMLFDHKSKDDNGAYFGTIQRVLSPAQLTTIIQQGVNDQELFLPGFIPGVPYTINDIFHNLETEFQNHVLTERHLRALTSYIIDRVALQARNIT